MLPTLLITFVFIGVGWFLLIRPQQERARQHAAVVDSLSPGEDVITAGGIHGTLTEVTEETVGIEVAPGVVLTVARPAIARRIEATDPEPDEPPTPEIAPETPGIDP